MGEVMEFAHGTWLPASGYQRAPTYEFELYDEEFDNQDPGSKFEYYIPIVPAQTD